VVSGEGFFTLAPPFFSSSSPFVVARSTCS